MSEQLKGHGHVTPNADGFLARCGGPSICKVCKAELAALEDRSRLVTTDWLKRIHRDLDACQKLIWANLRGCDPSYYEDAQERLREIDALLAAAPVVSAERQGPAEYQLPPFARKVFRKLERFQECTDDGQGADIGRHWFDLLTQLGLLNRVQRSPALWEITQQGEDLLAAAPAAQAEDALVEART